MNNSHNNIKRYIAEIINTSKAKIILAFLLMLCVSICNLIQPQFVKKIIDEAIPNKRISLLVFIVIGYIIISLLACFLNFILKYIYSVMKRNISIKYKNKLVYHMSNMQADFWENKKIGEMLKILDDDVFNIENFGVETIFTMFSQVVTALIAFCLLFSMQPMVLFIVIIIEFLEIALQSYFTKKITNRTREAREIAGSCFSILQEFVSNMINIVISKAKLPFWHKLISDEKKFRKKSIQLDMDIEISSNLSLFLHTLIIMIIYLLGGYWTIRGKMSLGTIVVYIEYVNMLTGPIYNIIRLNSAIQQTQVSLGKIYQILDEKPQIRQDNSGFKMEKEIESILFQNVYFHYIDKEAILKNVNLSFQTGRIIGLVGNTGCGKTTIVRLLFRLWEVNSGKILIDGVSIDQYNLYYLRKQMSIISQDIFIFNDTIWNNIVCGKKISDHKVLTLCRDIGIDEFVMKMEEGYGTFVGEKGIKLSGGQKQKIAIARAIVSGGKVLIMDEATASVDNISQNNIMNNIKPYIRDKIVIMIAHRLSTVKNADKIFVMKSGEVVGEGPHNELIQNCKEYQNLIAAEKQIAGN